MRFGFGDIGSANGPLAFESHVAGIWQLFSRSAIEQSNPHLGKPAFLTAFHYRTTKNTPKRPEKRNKKSAFAFLEKAAAPPKVVPKKIRARADLPTYPLFWFV